MAVTSTTEAPASWPTRWAARLRIVRGWRAHTIAALFGAAAAFALPPWHLIPLLVPAFTGLLWILVGRRPRAAFFLGWSFGLGHFLVAVHWIAHPMLVDPARHAWLIPFAVGGLAAALGLYVALTCLAFALLERRVNLSGPGRVLTFAALWLLFEWVRRWAFTGFPWDLLGYVWALSLEMSQSAALAGVYGLSLLTVIAAAAPAALSQGRHNAFAALVVFIPALLWAGGSARLATAPAPGAALVPDVQLRIVQANIPQKLKWQADRRVAHLERHVAMSLHDSQSAAPNVVIWPETAVPFFLSTDSQARALTAAAVPTGGILLTGAPRAGLVGEARLFWNSVHAIDSGGTVAGTYDKSHLVPFGEYVPARSLLPIQRIVASAGDFTAGPGRTTLRLDGVPPVGPLVCYEAIFPGAVTAADRPDWLLNVTNDAWFGPYVGPAQHFAIAWVRTIEEGLPLVRAANTGISAVVDGYGRVLQRLDSGTEGVIDSGLPAPLSPTLFARLGDWTVLILLGIAALATYFLRRAK